MPNLPIITDSIPKTFHFSWRKNGCNVNFNAEIEVPLQLSFNDLVGMLCAQNNVPIFVKNDLENSFRNFVDTETERYYNDSAQFIVENLRNGATKSSALKDFWLTSFTEEHKTFAAPEMITNDDVFRDAYQSLLTSSSEVVRKLLLKEKTFAEDVQKIIRARDWEVEGMKQEHATLIGSAVEDLAKIYTDQEVNKLAGDHFEKIHMLESNYASQLTAMMEEQKREFRQFVLSLNVETITNTGQLNFLDVPEENVTGHKRQHSDSLLESKRFDESFTIHLGAQLKTMHNLRLTALDPVDFLCRVKSKKLEESQRLQMALSLYSSQLNGLVLLVGCRPMHHFNLRTKFMKACEQSTELHFADLENQLRYVEKDLSRANQWRETFSSTPPHSDSLFAASESRTSESLQIGDIYVTRHSNLSEVHVVFHLVTGDDLKTQEINSRHPCINGLRNMIRLCYKFGVTNISIPLLLVDSLTEELTINWCLKRAELVFKCVKGFMMECATLSNADEHYTVQFFVPTEVSSDLFNQLSEMLPTIFHLANPLVATKQNKKQN